MEEGYPGNLKVKVIYTVNDANELKIDYEATSDKKTHVNLTHHSYFNLSGSDRINIEQHKLMINSNYYIPIDKNLIPTGNVQSVKDSPFDFKYSTKLPLISIFVFILEAIFFLGIFI